MRTYETLYIVKPDLEDDEIQTVANGVEKLVTDNGGVIVRSEIWGRRKLAYLVKGYGEGCYVLLRFEGEPEIVSRFQENFRYNEAVIRYLIVHFDERTLRLEAEQKQRKEDQIRARADTQYDAGPDEPENRTSRETDDVTIPVAVAPDASEYETETTETDMVEEVVETIDEEKLS